MSIEKLKMLHSHIVSMDSGSGDATTIQWAVDEIARLTARQNETAKAWTKLTESQEEEIASLTAEVDQLQK